jgi:hypothetical protein
VRNCSEQEKLMGNKKKRNKSKKLVERPGYKSIPLSPGTSKLVAEQLQRFTEKFGRPPGPEDPLLFDPSVDEPRPMVVEAIEHKMLEALHKAGVRPAMIYAFQKTGRLVTEKNRKKLTKAELKEWTDAVDEWNETHGGE